MRGIIIATLSCLLGLATVGLCQDEELPPEWLFDDDDEIVGWQNLTQLLPLELDEVKDKSGEDRTVLLTVSTGGDPYVYTNVTMPFDGGEYTTIYIGVRANITNVWQIYYITEEDGTYSERQRQNFEVSKSDDFMDLEFVMENGGWQDEIVTGFRLDPGTVAGVEAQIDYISLRGIPDDALPKAVEYSAKLAFTWGGIKLRDALD